MAVRSVPREGAQRARHLSLRWRDHRLGSPYGLHQCGGTMSRKRAATTSRPCKVHGDGAKRYKDGRCAECMRGRVHAYHQEHRDQVLAKAKTYYKANREEILAKQRAYRE